MSKWNSEWDGFRGHADEHWHRHGFSFMPFIGIALLGFLLLGPIFALFGLFLKLVFALLPLVLVAGLVWFAVKGFKAEFGGRQHSWNSDWSPKPKNEDHNTFYV